MAFPWGVEQEQVLSSWVGEQAGRWTWVVVEGVPLEKAVPDSSNQWTCGQWEWTWLQATEGYH